MCHRTHVFYIDLTVVSTSMKLQLNPFGGLSASNLCDKLNDGNMIWIHYLEIWAILNIFIKLNTYKPDGVSGYHN